MKINIKATTLDDLTVANIAKHIKMLDKEIDKSYYKGYSYCGDNYQEMCSLRESLVAAYNYFSVGEYE